MLERLAFYLALSILGLALAQLINWTNIATEGLDFWQWNRAMFSSIGVGTSWKDMFFPAAISTAVALFLRLLFPTATRWSRALVAAMTLFLAWRYILWRLFATINFSGFWVGLFSLLFFVVEMTGFTNEVISLVQNIWWSLGFKDRSAEADQLSKSVIQGTYRPTVDVLVPTYNESVDMLRRTLIGCQALDYQNKQVYLLDDGKRPQMKALAAELGCFYLIRPDNKHAKAGNLNHALTLLQGELVVVFDSDFVPTKNFLTRMVGFFQDSQIALVQTPKHFYNDETVAFNLGIPKSLTCEEDVFYRHVLPSRDVNNSIICHGTSYVVRRSALDRIGGFPTEAVVEDLYTSIQLQGVGYQLLYLNEALSAGAAPESIDAFVGQRLRWARGTFQLLFCQSNPLTLPGLTFIQRLQIFSAILFWCSVAARILFLIIPAFYFLFGWEILKTNINGVLSFWLSYYLFSLLTSDWMNGGTRSRFWSEVYQVLICFPLSVTMFQTIINPFGKGFHVTPKGLSLKGIQMNWQISMPLMLTMALSLILIVKAIATLIWEPSTTDGTIINMLWTLYNIALLWVGIQATIDVPQERRHIRFSHSLAFTLRLGEKLVSGTTVNLSESGVLLEVLSSGLQVQLPPEGALSIPEIGLVEIPVKLRRQKRQPPTLQLGMEFAHLSLPQQRRLIQFLFCRPGQWEYHRVSEARSLLAFILGVFRLYPLAETR